MQALSPIATSPATRDSAAAPAAPPESAATEKAIPPATSRDRPADSRTLRSSRREWDPQLSRQTAGAQQALAYLERLGAQLQLLKASLSARLASNQAGDAAMEGQIAAAEALWQRRPAEGGGSLDGQLRYRADGGAQQEFRIRGLDAAALRNGERETLAFSLGADKPALRATLEAGASPAAQIRRIDRALAPAGISASLDAEGEPLFSVAESAWPAVKDSLAIRGGGQRFPAGQAHRVKAEARPDAIQPSAWSGEDAAALRRSLQEVTQALERIRRIVDAVRQALDHASAQVIATSSPDPAWAASFAEDFGARGQAPDYEIYAEVAPALASVNRSRVLSLLSLK